MLSSFDCQDYPKIVKAEVEFLKKKGLLDKIFFFVLTVLRFLKPDQISAYHPFLGGQHGREYYTNRAGGTKRHQFNHHLPYNLILEFFQWEIVSWDSRRQDYTIQNTSLPSH